MKSNPLWVSDPGRTVDSIPMDLLTFREDQSCPVSQELRQICSVLSKSGLVVKVNRMTEQSEFTGRDVSSTLNKSTGSTAQVAHTNKMATTGLKLDKDCKKILKGKPHPKYEERTQGKNIFLSLSSFFKFFLRQGFIIFIRLFWNSQRSICPPQALGLKCIPPHLV